MEIKLIKFLQSAKNPFYDFIFTSVTHLASYIGFILVFATFLLIVFMKRKQKSQNLLNYTITFGITYGIGVLLNYILKVIINRPRPYEVDASIVNALEAFGQSMPSGHTLSATIICTFIVFGVYYFSKNKHLTIASAVLSGLFLVLTIISRMYLGQHYISDCIVGLVTAFVYSVLGIFIFLKLSKRENDNNR